MKSKKLFIKYCKENRYPLRDISYQIGFSGTAGYASLYNKRPFPKKYWAKVISVTKGAITLNDLIEDYLVFQLKKLPFKSKVSYSQDHGCWMVVAEKKQS